MKAESWLYMKRRKKESSLPCSKLSLKVMPGGSIAICQSGGDFITNKDGTLPYNEGDMHTIDIDEETACEELKSVAADMWNCNGAVSFPGKQDSHIHL